MLASTTTQDDKKSSLTNVCKTNTILPLDPATFILEAVGNIMIQYLSYKDILNISLVIYLLFNVSRSYIWVLLFEIWV